MRPRGVRAAPGGRLPRMAHACCAAWAPLVGCCLSPLCCCCGKCFRCSCSLQQFLLLCKRCSTASCDCFCCCANVCFCCCCNCNCFCCCANVCFCCCCNCNCFCCCANFLFLLLLQTCFCCCPRRLHVCQTCKRRERTFGTARPIGDGLQVAARDVCTFARLPNVQTSRMNVWHGSPYRRRVAGCSLRRLDVW